MKRPAARAGKRNPRIGALKAQGQLWNLAFVLLKSGVFGKEIKQGANACRKWSALADIDGIELLDVSGIELLQNGNEAAGGDIGADGEFGHAGKTGGR